MHVPYKSTPSHTERSVPAGQQFSVDLASFRPSIVAKVDQLGTHWVISLGLAVNFQAALVCRELGHDDCYVCFNSLGLAVVSLR